MPLMQEAMTKENWERQEGGLRPLKANTVKRPEPKRPNIDNEIKFEDIPIEDFVELEYAKRNTLKNEEGVRFLGYDVSMILSSTASLKRKPGRPMKDVSKEISSEPKTLTGWMQEGDFLSLIRNCRKKINPQVVNW
jgi:hypothetical protein